LVALGCCPSCGSGARRRWFRHPQLRLWLCEDCGLGYCDPQAREAVRQRYLREHDLAAHFAAHEARKRALNARRLESLPDPISGQRLLDVGCGDGLFAAMARGRGWQAHGVELNPPAAARARDRGIAVVEGRLEHAGLPDASFHLVTAWDVIEHVPEPPEFVTHLARVVAPGGTLVVTTLNRRALVARAFRGRWSMVADEHFTYWDIDSLRRAFARAGMRTVRATSFGLGRDFVTWIDRCRGRPAHLAAAGDGLIRAQPPQDAGWDTRRVLLAAEAMLNRALDVTSLGVGVQLVLRARGRD
jgi:SAM-dependent methyltransferase